MHLGVVFLRLDPEDVAGGNHGGLSGNRQDNPLLGGGGVDRLRGQRLGWAASLAHGGEPCQGAFEPGRRDRLEQVVACRRFKRLDGIVFEGGDHHAKDRRIEPVEHREPIAARHLHIDKNGVGLHVGDHLLRLVGTACPAHHLDVVVSRQELGQPATRGGFVVHKHHPQRRRVVGELIAVAHGDRPSVRQPWWPAPQAAKGWRSRCRLLP